MLMETLVAMVLLAVISLATMAALTAGIVSQRQSRQRTLAEQLAGQELERIRQLPYSSVGLVNGNPAGTLAASDSLSASGLAGLMTRQVRWVDDRAPTAYATQADYKSVTLIVTRQSDSKVLTKQQTYVSPSDDASYGGVSRGTLKVAVIDMATNTPIQDVSVSIANGPSAASSDVTDASGTAIFPSLLPNPASGSQAYYDVSVTAPTGFVTLPDDLPTAPGSAAHLKVAAAATSSPVIRLYRPATVSFNVTRSGVPYTGSATATLTSSRGTNTFTFTGGSYTVPTGVVSGLQYTASASAGGLSSNSVTQTVPDLSTYPANLASTFNLVLPDAVGLSAPPTAMAGTTIPASLITATLTGINGSGSGSPLTFKVFGPQPNAPTTCTSGGITVGTATPSGNGAYHPSAGFTPSSSGTYWWYVSWPGDAGNGASSSDCPPTVKTVVSLASPLLTIAAPATATKGTALPASAIAATMSGLSGTGSSAAITFNVFGPSALAPSTCTSGGTTIGTRAPSGNGVYSPSAGFTPASPGNYWWYATWPGDGNNSPASSACPPTAKTVVTDPDTFSILTRARRLPARRSM